MSKFISEVMFDSGIIEPNQENKQLLYTGFEIVTYTGRSNQEALKQELKRCFSGDGWTFFDYEHRFFVNYEPFNTEVEVFFGDTIYQNGFTKNAEKYKITFKSTYMGIRARGETTHKKLCYMLLSRIRWKKLGFWLKDGKRFLIPRMKRIKSKRT
jgi:hypothetical protein